MENIKIKIGEKEMKEKNKEIFSVIGEYISYFYILSVFINSKLNMKIGYLLLVITLINVWIDKEKIKKVNKNIYVMFFIIFVMGIIWNYFGSASDGIDKFIRENGKFIYGIALIILLNEKKKKEINFIIAFGINILSILFLYFNFPWLLNNDLTRARGIILMGITYLLIYSLEKLFREKKILWILSSIFPILALIKTNSRMGAVVLIIILGIYLLQKLIENKKNLKYIFIIFIILLGSIKIIPSNYINRVKTSFHTKNNVSNEDRIVMWKAAVHIFNENRIFGIGNDSKDSIPLIQEYVDKNVADKRIRNEFLLYPRFPRVHNMYLDFLMQNGIMIILYLFLLFYVIPKELIFKIKNKTAEILSGTYSILSFYIYGITWSVWSDYGIVHTLFQIILAVTILYTINDKERLN